jgi:hypothetical protein
VPHGSELNQVWTNIIGNATGAIGGHARVLARRRDSGGYAIGASCVNRPDESA